MQLDNTDFISRRASLRKHLVCTGPRHPIPYHLHRTSSIIRLWRIRHERGGNDLDGLVLQPMFMDEILIRNNTTRRPIRRRAAHKHRQLLRDLLPLQHVLHAPPVAELAVRIVHGVLVVLARDPRQVLHAPAVLLEVLLRGVVEHPRRARSVVPSECFLGFCGSFVEEHSRGGAVGEVGSEAAWTHLFEPEGEGAGGLAVANGGGCVIESSGSS